MEGCVRDCIRRCFPLPHLAEGHAGQGHLPALLELAAAALRHSLREPTMASLAPQYSLRTAY